MNTVYKAFCHRQSAFFIAQLRYGLNYPQIRPVMS